jgi:hypothetical protein
VKYVPISYVTGIKPSRLSDFELLDERECVNSRLALVNVPCSGRDKLLVRLGELDREIDSRGIVERLGGYEE